MKLQSPLLALMPPLEKLTSTQSEAATIPSINMQKEAASNPSVYTLVFFSSDREIHFSSTAWLTDSIIDAAQHLLKEGLLKLNIIIAVWVERVGMPSKSF